MVTVKKGGAGNARRMLFFGDNGIGKSELAGSFPSPLVLNFEDGMSGIAVDQTDLITSYEQTVESLAWIHDHDREHQTIVSDTADWLERLVFRKTATDRDKETIEDIGYGKGYEAASYDWDYLLAGYARLWKQGRHIIFTAHLSVEKFKAPDSDQYNFYAPALHPQGSSSLVDWCDDVLFLRTKVSVLTKTGAFNAKTTQAIGGEERVIVTQERASHVAKNRLNLPYEIPMTWPRPYDALAKYLTNCRLMPVGGVATAEQKQVEPASQRTEAPAGNIFGVVTDGSSKPKVETNAVREEVFDGLMNRPVA